MSGQNVAASVERLQAIADGVRQVLGDEPHWITPQEFLANVEAHRRKHDQGLQNRKRINSKPASERDYFLKVRPMCNRQMEFGRLEVGQ
jgi:hypothetical protein